MTERRATAWRAVAVAGAALVMFGFTSAAVTETDPTPTPAPTRTPIVITNDNLADFAAKGHVTSAEEASKSGSKGRRPIHAPGTDASKRTSVDAVESADQLAYDEKRHRWQSTYKQQLELVASIEQQIGKLDWEIPGLWRDFYAWDDPAYRDGVIKVKLDEALARRQRLEGQLENEREQLDRILRDARKDGAQPGWFRGIEKPTPIPRAP